MPDLEFQLASGVLVVALSGLGWMFRHLMHRMNNVEKLVRAQGEDIAFIKGRMESR